MQEDIHHQKHELPEGLEEIDRHQVTLSAVSNSSLGFSSNILTESNPFESTDRAQCRNSINKNITASVEQVQTPNQITKELDEHQQTLRNYDKISSPKSLAHLSKSKEYTSQQSKKSSKFLEKSQNISKHSIPNVSQIQNPSEIIDQYRELLKSVEFKLGKSIIGKYSGNLSSYSKKKEGMSNYEKEYWSSAQRILNDRLKLEEEEDEENFEASQFPEKQQLQLSKTPIKGIANIEPNKIVLASESPIPQEQPPGNQQTSANQNHQSFFLNSIQTNQSEQLIPQECSSSAKDGLILDDSAIKTFKNQHLLPHESVFLKSTRKTTPETNQSMNNQTTKGNRLHNSSQKSNNKLDISEDEEKDNNDHSNDILLVQDSLFDQTTLGHTDQVRNRQLKHKLKNYQVADRPSSNLVFQQFQTHISSIPAEDISAKYADETNETSKTYIDTHLNSQSVGNSHDFHSFSQDTTPFKHNNSNIIQPCRFITTKRNDCFASKLQNQNQQGICKQQIRSKSVQEPNICFPNSFENHNNFRQSEKNIYLDNIIVDQAHKSQGNVQQAMINSEKITTKRKKYKKNLPFHYKSNYIIEDERCSGIVEQQQNNNSFSSTHQLTQSELKYNINREQLLKGIAKSLANEDTLYAILTNAAGNEIKQDLKKDSQQRFQDYSVNHLNNNQQAALPQKQYNTRSIEKSRNSMDPLSDPFHSQAVTFRGKSIDLLNNSNSRKYKHQPGKTLFQQQKRFESQELKSPQVFFSQHPSENTHNKVKESFESPKIFNSSTDTSLKYARIDEILSQHKTSQQEEYGMSLKRKRLEESYGVTYGADNQNHDLSITPQLSQQFKLSFNSQHNRNTYSNVIFSENNAIFTPPITFRDLYLKAFPESTLHTLLFQDSENPHIHPVQIESSNLKFKALQELLKQYQLTLIRAVAAPTHSPYVNPQHLASSQLTTQLSSYIFGSYLPNDSLEFTQPLALFHAAPLHTLAQILENSSFASTYHSQPAIFSFQTNLASEIQKHSLKSRIFNPDKQNQELNTRKWRLILARVDLGNCKVDESSNISYDLSEMADLLRISRLYFKL